MDARFPLLAWKQNNALSCDDDVTKPSGPDVFLRHGHLEP